MFGLSEKENLQKAIDDSNAVNDWLLALKQSDPVEFERVRMLPFAEQSKLAGVS